METGMRMDKMDGYTLRLCTPNDTDALVKLGRATYRDAFLAGTGEALMNTYLDEAFAPEKIRGELENPLSTFVFLCREDEPVGYIKLNEAAAQTDLHEADSLELERIYVLAAHAGRGLGGMLLQKAVQIARERGKISLWLGVWTENQNAIAFYKRHGFAEWGRHPFQMGEVVYQDLVMRLEL